MPNDYDFHKYCCDFQPVNDNKILSLTGLITRVGTRQKDGEIISHVEGGVPIGDEKKEICFYIIGYNGYSSNGMLEFSLIPDGKTVVYDACFQECKEDNCYYGAYYSVDISGEEKETKFGGFVKLVDTHSYNEIPREKTAKAISSFGKRNRTIYPKTVGYLNGNLAANLCEHADRKEKIEAAKSFFRARLADEPEHRKSIIPSYLK